MYNHYILFHLWELLNYLTIFFRKNRFNLAKRAKSHTSTQQWYPHLFSQRSVGEWAVNNNKKHTWISWIYRMCVLAAYGSSVRWISHNTDSINGKNRRKTIYNIDNVSWSWVEHGVRPFAPVACASLVSFAPAMSFSGHFFSWDVVIVY